MPGHNIPMAIAGTFILAFGWFGFNPGSTLAGGDLRIGVVAVNTMLAGAAGAFTAMLYIWMQLRQARPEHDGQRPAGRPGGDHGAVRVRQQRRRGHHRRHRRRARGRVAVFFVERTLKVDDPVGAISVHGVNGAWGVLSLGLFADGSLRRRLERRARHGDGPVLRRRNQFAAQCIGTLTCFVFVFASFYLFFKIVDVSSAIACRPRSSSKDWTSRRWARSPIPTSSLVLGLRWAAQRIARQRRPTAAPG